MALTLFLMALLVGGCLCTESNQRDSTSICVEMQGRMNPGHQAREDQSRPGMMGAPQYQQPYSPQYPNDHAAMPAQGMNQGMAQGEPQGMAQGMSQGMPHGMPQAMPPGMPVNGMVGMPHGMPGMPPPGMFMPPQFRGRGMPPMHMDPGPMVIIKRLQEELAAKDHEIHELKAILNQHKMHQPDPNFHSPPQAMPSQHRQPEH